jgi:hypothetical protein
VIAYPSLLPISGIGGGLFFYANPEKPGDCFMNACIVKTSRRWRKDRKVGMEETIDIRPVDGRLADNRLTDE